VCRLPDDASGWWLVLAEVLAVVVLLALAHYAGGQAQRLSQRIDRAALADMARSNPMEVCVTGDETLTGWGQSTGPPRLEAKFAWPNGTRADCWANRTRFPSELVDPSFDSMVSSHNNNTLADEYNIALADGLTLSALFKCGVIGLAETESFSEAIRDDKLAGLRTSAFGIDPRNHSYTEVYVLDTDRAELHGHQLTALDAAKLPLGNLFGIFFKYESLQVFSYHNPYPDFAGVVRLGWRGPGRHGNGGFGDQYAAWLWIAEQNDKTAECMAQNSTVDVELALRSYLCRTGGEEGKGVPPKALDMTVSGLRVTWFDRTSKPYACASGVDDASPNFAAMMGKLSAYKARQKAALTIDLFGSMVKQTSDDVYAVYTGILGALFGAFALLVTTMFVYLVAALKRSFVCQ